MFSITYRPSKTQFHSISFQNFWPLRFAFTGMRPVWCPFLGAGSLSRPALFISVEAWNPRNHRKYRCHRHQNRGTGPLHATGYGRFRLHPIPRQHSNNRSGVGCGKNPSAITPRVPSCPALLGEDE
jgi:hypothetical protein